MSNRLAYHPSARVIRPAAASRKPKCGFHTSGGFCSHECSACDQRIAARKLELARADARRTIALMRAPQGR